MATGNPDTVEAWAPMFTRSFTDEQIIRDCVSRAGSSLWCRLCDAPVPQGQSGEAHAKEHKRELREWRTRQRRDARKRSLQGLKTARQEKKLQRKPEEE